MTGTSQDLTTRHIIIIACAEIFPVANENTKSEKIVFVVVVITFLLEENKYPNITISVYSYLHNLTREDSDSPAFFVCFILFG